MLQFLVGILSSSCLLAPQPLTRLVQDATQSAPKEVVLYDVRDIPPGERESRKGGLTEAAAVQEATESAARLLKSFGPLRQDEAVFVVPQREVVQPGLGVFAGPETHAWIREWLALQRSGALLDVQASFIEAPAGRFEELGSDPSAPAALDARQLERLRIAQQAEDVELLASPRVLFPATSMAVLSTQEQVTYVKDWRLVVVEPGARELAVPTLDTLEHGLRLEVLGTLLPDGTIGLEVGASHTKLLHLRPFELRLRPSEQTVELALPETQRISFSSRVVLADGASILLGGMVHEPGRQLSLLLQAKVVQPRVEQPAGAGDQR